MYLFRMKTTYLGAIDIGANATRLLVASVETGQLGNTSSPDSSPVRPVKRLALRIPLRLGEDVFSTGKIQRENSRKLKLLLQSFKNLFQVLGVETWRACATSAMRDAKNGPQIVRELERATGIRIEIISGETEAELIFGNEIATRVSDGHRYVCADIGGGSVELSLVENKQRRDLQSFNAGTLRLIAGKVAPEEFVRLDAWLAAARLGAPSASTAPVVEVIATGGNIGELSRLARIKDGANLSVAKLRAFRAKIAATPVSRRVVELGISPERADVILPAADLYLRIARGVGAKSFYVPSSGLADGILYSVFAQH